MAAKKPSSGKSGKSGETKLYFFGDRNTGVAATSAKQARENKQRGSDKIEAVKKPTAAGKKAMQRGDWDRTRKDGKSPEQSAYGKGRGQGPPRKKK